MIHVGELKEELIQYAKEIGVDKIRFASADTFDSLKDRLILHESLGYLSGFEEPDIEKRTNPSLLLPKAKSIFAIALAHPSKMHLSFWMDTRALSQQLIWPSEAATKGLSFFQYQAPLNLPNTLTIHVRCVG
ncbi:hypothetical protein, partial [Clavibacter michiganensis]|uniref:hypothetical protein n=1 Tax=Clavibacter michiganensis TaxID=28447 RepID=UPI00374E0890